MWDQVVKFSPAELLSHSKSGAVVLRDLHLVTLDPASTALSKWESCGSHGMLVPQDAHQSPAMHRALFETDQV